MEKTMKSVTAIITAGAIALAPMQAQAGPFEAIGNFLGGAFQGAKDSVTGCCDADGNNWFGNPGNQVWDKSSGNPHNPEDYSKDPRYNQATPKANPFKGKADNGKTTDKPKANPNKKGKKGTLTKRPKPRKTNLQKIQDKAKQIEKQKAKQKRTPKQKRNDNKTVKSAKNKKKK